MLPAAGVIFAVSALAQDIRPGDERPELPTFKTDDEAELAPRIPLPEIPHFDVDLGEEGQILPRVILPSDSDSEKLEAGRRIFVRSIELRENTVLSKQALQEVVAPFLGRELSYADLQSLRDQLVLAYVDRGYVTSGVVIPEQPIEGGRLVLLSVEGQLADIQVETDGRLRAGYVGRGLRRRAGTPINVFNLEEALEILQQDGRIEKIEAALVPGATQGESILKLRVKEARPYGIQLGAHNDTSPAIGSGTGQIRLHHLNLTGFGDSLSANYQVSRGLHDLSARYVLPFGPWNTRIAIHMRRTWSEIVEKPFSRFDIESQSGTYGLSLIQSMYHSPTAQLDFFVLVEYRRSQSFLEGESTSFVPGPIRGISRESVLRFGNDWSYSSRAHAVALRSMISIGLDVNDATNNSGDVPDGQFVVWLGQAQWAWRIPSAWKLHLVARADVQIADRPLLGLEQFAVGGPTTVRGYRTNQLVRDNGTVGSVEVRIPIPLPRLGRLRPSFELAPFVDVGHSWNEDRPTVGRQTLVSVGVGGRLGLPYGFAFQIYWGHALKSVGGGDDDSLQDDGVNLGVTWTW